MKSIRVMKKRFSSDSVANSIVKGSSTSLAVTEIITVTKKTVKGEILLLTGEIRRTTGNFIVLPY